MPIHHTAWFCASWSRNGLTSGFASAAVNTWEKGNAVTCSTTARYRRPTHDKYMVMNHEHSLPQDGRLPSLSPFHFLESITSQMLVCC
jgi:hypothetical protein